MVVIAVTGCPIFLYFDTVQSRVFEVLLDGCQATIRLNHHLAVLLTIHGAVDLVLVTRLSAVDWLSNHLSDLFRESFVWSQCIAFDDALLVYFLLRHPPDAYLAVSLPAQPIL